VNKSKILIVCIFLTCSLLVSSLAIIHSCQSNTYSPIYHQADLSAPNNQLATEAVSPFYDIRIPIAYNVSNQPGIIVSGTLDSLAFENTTMQFRRDFTNTRTGMTFAIFTISTAGVNLTAKYNLTLNIEGSAMCSTHQYANFTQITIYLYNRTSWSPIYSVTSPSDSIDWVNGWCEYSIPLPYDNYLAGTSFRVKVELMQQLTVLQTWTQRLYLHWLLLELRKDVALAVISPTKIAMLTSGFSMTGGIAELAAEDGNYFQIERPLPAGGEKGAIQFILSYNLGYYGMDSLFGLRFAHFEWFGVVGATSYSRSGSIYLNMTSGNQFLCLLRHNTLGVVRPDIHHTCFPIEGDWQVNGTLRLLYKLDYNVIGNATIRFLVDWARLQIIRPPNPIVSPRLLNETIYAGQTVWLNITCLDGKAPISEIRMQPWNELVGTAAGCYLYAHKTDAGGKVSLSLVLKDAEGDQYSQPIGILTVIHRPLSISLYLSEEPYAQEFIIQLQMRDILSNTPIPRYSFTKTILQNGTWFRQQTHQTNPSGFFSIHEPVQDYLDWNYTVIISTPQTSLYEATTVYASIVLSKCPPYLFINQIRYATPLRANDPIVLNYTVTCLTPLEALWLCKNGSLFLPLPIDLGTHNVTFHDVGGTWEYWLYANNSRKFQGYSAPFILKITPLKTALQLKSTLELESHAVALEIRLYDELNRSCVNVPLHITVFDNGQVFYEQTVTTGMDGVALLVHFDQYLDHSFTIQVTSEATPFYKGALLTAGTLSYHGYPLYWVITLGLIGGIVGGALLCIRWRFKLKNV